MTTEVKAKVQGKGRGFASMTGEQKRAIASKGGKAAHANGTPHKFQAGSEEAREAGRRGGSRSRRGPAKQSGA